MSGHARPARSASSTSAECSPPPIDRQPHGGPIGRRGRRPNDRPPRHHRAGRGAAQGPRGLTRSHLELVPRSPGLRRRPLPWSRPLADAAGLEASREGCLGRSPAAPDVLLVDADAVRRPGRAVPVRHWPGALADEAQWLDTVGPAAVDHHPRQPVSLVFRRVPVAVGRAVAAEVGTVRVGVAAVSMCSTTA